MFDACERYIETKACLLKDYGYCENQKDCTRAKIIIETKEEVLKALKETQ